MPDPWLTIPLADDEAHMALPAVAQAAMLADVLAGALREHRPRSVAVLGCAGGNGFERISPADTPRVVGIDLNPAYVEEARRRFGAGIPQLELFAGDVHARSRPAAPNDSACRRSEARLPSRFTLAGAEWARTSAAAGNPRSLTTPIRVQAFHLS